MHMQTTVSEVLAEKVSEVHHVQPSDLVTSAVQTMCDRRIGAVLVCKEQTPVGIFTERDVMSRIILQQRDPTKTTVNEVMTRDVVAIEPTTTTGEAMAIMTERKCRHLPVVQGGKVIGVLSIGDLVRHLSRAQEFEIRMLTDYVQGVYPG
jgi:IMP dehydrogenase